VHVHLHQFVIQAVGLVETLAEFHQLKVLGPDVLQVRQLGLLIDAISPTDVALALDDHEIDKLDFSGKLGDLPVKSFCYFLIIISILSPLPSSRRGHRDVDTKRFIKVFWSSIESTCNLMIIWMSSSNLAKSSVGQVFGRLPCPFEMVHIHGSKIWGIFAFLTHFHNILSWLKIRNQFTLSLQCFSFTLKISKN